MADPHGKATGPGSDDRLLVLSRSWEHDGIRGSIRPAGGSRRRLAALGGRRRGARANLGPPRADGAFDVSAVGSPLAVGRWPTPTGSQWPDLRPATLCLVERGDRGALDLATTTPRASPVVALSGTARLDEDPGGHEAVLSRPARPKRLGHPQLHAHAPGLRCRPARGCQSAGRGQASQRHRLRRLHPRAFGPAPGPLRGLAGLARLPSCRGAPAERRRRLVGGSLRPPVPGRRRGRHSHRLVVPLAPRPGIHRNPHRPLAVPSPRPDDHRPAARTSHRPRVRRVPPFLHANRCPGRQRRGGTRRHRRWPRLRRCRRALRLRQHSERPGRRRAAETGRQAANETYGDPERFTAAVTAALEKVAPLATEMADR